MIHAMWRLQVFAQGSFGVEGVCLYPVSKLFDDGPDPHYSWRDLS